MKRASSRSAVPLRGSIWAVALLVLLAVGATAVSAADSQRVPLGHGALSAPKGSWEAIAVPRGSILIDVFEADGAVSQTYGKSYGDVPPRGLRAYGFRPGGLPTRHGLLAGATGERIRKVKIYLKGGATRSVRTIASPADWEVANRLYALGFTIPASYKANLRVVTKIEGLDSAGRLISTLRAVPTGSY
ncbi:MAG: hypothetical protein WA862_08285 [Solirubrobacterales bacterium]